MPPAVMPKRRMGLLFSTAADGKPTVSCGVTRPRLDLPGLLHQVSGDASGDAHIDHMARRAYAAIACSCAGGSIDIATTVAFAVTASLPATSRSWLATSRRVAASSVSRISRTAYSVR